MFAPFNTNTPLSNFGAFTVIPQKFLPKPPPCNCPECPECSKQYRTLAEQMMDSALSYEEYVSADDAAEIAVNLARQSEKNREYISTQLAFKGVGMVKWKGKASKAREQ
jgi:hypothetical protein